VSSDPDCPRIWWCPTGPLTFLPIHAAGFYNRSERGHKVSDFVASSYIPTFSALLKLDVSSPKQFNGILAITQPETPRQSPLPAAKAELIKIQQYCPPDNIQILSGKFATVQSVLEGLKNRSWVHFACHAIQDMDEPMQSGFILEDGRLTLLDIASNSFPQADFAFLSACQTATGDENLAGEAVHLAAGLLSAGYRSVIATMWSINDSDAPPVTAEVYSLLEPGKNPDSTQAANALRRAVEQLRLKRFMDTGRPSFISWMPFIHVGL
jgi:CHAT domain-containing protein